MARRVPGSAARPPGAHISSTASALNGAHLQTPDEGLATEDLGIRGALEFREAVEALWSRPLGQLTRFAVRAIAWR